MNWVRRKAAGLREMLAFDNGFALAVDRIVHRQARLAVYRRGPVEVAVDRTGGDLASIRACLATGMYRDLLTSLPFAHGLTALDIGANVGGFSLLLIDMGYKLDRVVAVELNPNTFVRLKANLVVNLHGAPTDVRVVNAGVWYESRVLNQRFGWGDTGDRVDIGDLPSGGQPVNLLTLDQLIDRELGSATIDICKIDIEGAEHEIFGRPGC